MSVKNILICTSQVPLRYGGTEILVDRLREALNQRGFQVDVVSIPFRDYPNKEILKGHLVWRLLDLTESDGQKVDMVIATKFPSYLVQHPNKVTWLVHQFRQAYDFVGTKLSPFAGTPEDKSLLPVIHRLDTAALGESRRDQGLPVGEVIFAARCVDHAVVHVPGEVVRTLGRRCARCAPRPG